eukprot:2908660-Ditylum_brightwellii.AAC.1
MFIGDTGATCDSTFSEIGLTNKQQAGKLDSIVDASGNSIKGNVVGDMPIIVWDKNEQEKLDIIIKGIIHLPQAGYNLSSITKQPEEGWAPGGCIEAIWIAKGKQKNMFNINIKTPKGAIFAIYLKCKINMEEEVAAV